MPKRKPKKATSTRKRADTTAGLRKALTARSKAELVSVLLELAQADRKILRQLTARFDVTPAPTELIAATRRAIGDATDFDEREINRNFDYDYDAYDEVKRNLSQKAILGPPVQIGLRAIEPLGGQKIDEVTKRQLVLPGSGSPQQWPKRRMQAPLPGERGERLPHHLSRGQQRMPFPAAMDRLEDGPRELVQPEELIDKDRNQARPGTANEHKSKPAVVRQRPPAKLRYLSMQLEALVQAAMIDGLPPVHVRGDIRVRRSLHKFRPP